MAKALDDVFQENIAEVKADNKSYRKKHDYSDDVAIFVKDYRHLKLFRYIPDREYPSFKGFTSSSSTISAPDMFKARLIKYTKKLDRSKIVFNN